MLFLMYRYISIQYIEVFQDLENVYIKNTNLENSFHTMKSY